MGGLGDIYAQLQKTIGASDRILEILGDPSEVDIYANETKASLAFGAINIQDIHFSYPSRPSIEILKGISFTIEPGQKIAIVGTSGTGKSTLAQLMMRFYEPSQGKIMMGDCRTTNHREVGTVIDCPLGIGC